MTTTLGPRFAIRARLESSWTDLSGSESEQVLLSEAGEAFRVEVPSKAFRDVLRRGDLIWVYIGQILREDAEIWFGFQSVEERQLFVSLLQLEDVGPKLSATLVAHLGPEGLLALMDGKFPASQKVPGLGPKTKDKLVAALQLGRDKFRPLLMSISKDKSSQHATATSIGEFGKAPLAYLMALQQLGLRALESQELFDQLSKDIEGFAQWSLAEQIRSSLQHWGRTRSSHRLREVERT